MYRSKDFLLTDVMNINGKKLGCISDILMDFSRKKILGFVIQSYGFMKKNFTVLVEDIVSFNFIMVVNKVENEKGLLFTTLRGMDVTDRKGNILGMVEDILFDEDDFTMKAIVVSTGFITNFIHGKKVVLIRDLILGDKNVLLNKNEEEVTFSSLPHKLFSEGLCDDREEEKEKIN